MTYDDRRRYPVFPTFPSLEVAWKSGAMSTGNCASPQAFCADSEYWNTLQHPFNNALGPSAFQINSELLISSEKLATALPFAGPGYSDSPYTPWPKMEVDEYSQQQVILEGYCHINAITPSCLDGRCIANEPGVVQEDRKPVKLSARERARNENGKFFCNICQRRYARRERKETCESNHNDERLFQCNSGCGVAGCTRSYSSPDCLRRHQRPPEQRQILCPKCNCFTSKQNIARHKDRCHGRGLSVRS